LIISRVDIEARKTVFKITALKPFHPK